MEQGKPEGHETGRVSSYGDGDWMDITQSAGESLNAGILPTLILYTVPKTIDSLHLIITVRTQS